MAYFHVIAKLKPTGKETCLFSDLTRDDLLAKFLLPYEEGKSFLSGADVIQSLDIASLQIIETIQDSETERESIYRRSLAEIDEFNRGPGPLLISLGRGYEAGDIAEAGQDVTATFIKGPPGHKPRTPAAMPSGTKESSALKTLAITIGGGLVVAGIAKWLGWV